MRHGVLKPILKTVKNNQPLLVRLIVGLIFLSEGIQKFLYPGLVGAGRFEKIGFSDPAFWAYLTGTFEVICGALILSGLFTRIASVPLLIIMTVAVITTKMPVLMERGLGQFAHDSRTDFAMTFLLVYLLIYGAGKWSADSRISGRRF